MAIALVSSGAMSIAATTSVTPAFGVATTAGNFLVACVGAELGGASDVVISGTGAPGWIRVPLNFGGSASIDLQAMFYKENCKGSETAPTFSNATASSMQAALTEFSGVATDQSIDQLGGASSNSAAANSAADSTTGNLAVYCGRFPNSKSTTYTVSTAWTPVGGTKVADLNSGGTKNSQVFVQSMYLLGTSGGSAADSITITVTPSSGTISSQAATMASFVPATFTTQRSRLPIKKQLQNVKRSYFF